ncbi:8963_t:CDS:2, partial [Funneliformis geosporum]
MSAVYQEIKRLTQELLKENFTKIIAYISKDVSLTNQMKDALALFDTDEEKRNYLVTFLDSIGAEPDLSFEELMKQILKGSIARSDSTIQDFSSCIPLKERNMTPAIKIISKNFIQSKSASNATVAKSGCEFLVCCGAPGIGKTRYGVELFNHLKKNPEEISRHSPFAPDFLSIYLDFGQNVELDVLDNNLSVDSILAIRIAFEFFVSRSNQMDFIEFRAKVYQHFKQSSTTGLLDLGKFHSIINLSNVIRNIRKYRRLPNNQTLFIFLHIDEIQIIFNYEKYWRKEDVNLQSERSNHSSYQETKKGIFKKLLYVLGSYMKSNINFIQTFLSGTALQDVVQQKEPTMYTFDYINCPLLSMTACIEIVDHFAKQYGDTELRWCLDRPFIKILDDARGLPRAIEYILNDVLGTSHDNAKNFFGDSIKGQYLQQSSDFFIRIAVRLDKSYAITNFVEKNKNLALVLLKNCMRNDSVTRSQKVLMNDENCSFTYGELERDQHIILEENNKQLSITMPVYFIYLYNKVLKLADGILANMLKPDSVHGMEWKHWELFVTHFEAFKVNLL